MEQKISTETRVEPQDGEGGVGGVHVLIDDKTDPEVLEAELKRIKEMFEVSL